MSKDKIIISIGIFVHNEEKNIESLLRSITKQKLSTVTIKEIIVVSSGSNDLTNQIVRNWKRKGNRIKLICEVNRRGKSAAVNLFLRTATAPVLATISGDLRLHPQAIEEISVPFLIPEVGMAGARPVPKNTSYSTIGKEVALLWELHHQLSLIQPKCGEMVAFRNIIHRIPVTSAVDEATLEVLLKILGYEIVYAPRSIVYNKGPLTLKEFITQRRRVYAGHEWVNLTYNYRVASMNTHELLHIVWRYFLTHPSQFFIILRLISLEILARTLGFIDYHLLDKNPYVWKMISR